MTTAYAKQEIDHARSLGLNSNAAYREHLQRKTLKRIAREVARDIAQGAGPGTLPIVWNGNGFEPIPILDCPRSWTPRQCAQYREIGSAIVRELQGDRQLAALVAHYCTTEPANQLGYGDRYRAKLAAHLGRGEATRSYGS